jgi:hypothetical protein
MKLRPFALVAALGLLLATALVAPCTAEEPEHIPWLTLDIGGASYAMDDLNEEIGYLNAGLAEYGLVMDEVNSGVTYGIGLGWDVGQASMGFGYERLTGRTEVGDWSGSIEYKVPANVFRAFARFNIKTTSKVEPYVEGSLGILKPAGQVKITITDEGSESGSFEGSGAALAGAFGLHVWATPKFAIGGSLGYRRAEIGDLKVAGRTVRDMRGGEYTLNYSGVFARVEMQLRP